MDNILNTFRIPVLKLNKLFLEQLKLVKQDIIFVIKQQIKNEATIEYLFDKLLDLVNFFGDDIEELYYVLLDYYKDINLKQSQFYEQIYLETLDIDCIPISQNKKSR